MTLRGFQLDVADNLDPAFAAGNAFARALIRIGAAGLKTFPRRTHRHPE
jgi:hypothetical protein